MKYKNHTIKRTKCSTDVRREAFGRGYWDVADIYTIVGPVVMAGATERLTTIKECKEFITEALKEKETKMKNRKCYGCQTPMEAETGIDEKLVLCDNCGDIMDGLTWDSRVEFDRLYEQQLAKGL